MQGDCCHVRTCRAMKKLLSCKETSKGQSRPDSLTLLTHNLDDKLP